mgnify:CR=1 FL=1
MYMLETEFLTVLNFRKSSVQKKLKVPQVPIAFFDLDHTILNKDLNSNWVRWRLRSTWKGVMEGVIGLHNYVYYKRGKLSEKSINRYYWARTLGVSVERYKSLVYNFFHELGKYHIAPESVQLIQLHKQMGSNVSLITAQDDYIASHFSSYLNMDKYISNKRIVEDNKFVGMESPNCYGEGKIEFACNYAKDVGVNLSDCAFYSDSISDLPLLREVKHPIAINPDFWLEKVAMNSNWRIYKF